MLLKFHYATALPMTSLAYPIQMLMVVVSVGTGVGINSLISRKIGAKDYDAVGNILTTGLLLGVFSSVVFILFGSFLAPWFFNLYMDDLVLKEKGIIYLRICTWFSLGNFAAAVASCAYYLFCSSNLYPSPRIVII